MTNNTKIHCKLLKEVLVVAAPTFLWITAEAKVFPYKLLGPKGIELHNDLTKHQRLSIICFVIYVFLHVFFRRPKIILFSSVDRIVYFFIACRRIGLFQKTKFIFFSHCSYYPVSDLLVKYIANNKIKYLDKIVYYSVNVILKQSHNLRSKFYFIPWCAPGDYTTLPLKKQKHFDYIFAGGQSDRDFISIIEAFRSLHNIQLHIETWRQPELANIHLPKNCTMNFRSENTYGRTTTTIRQRQELQDFLEIMSMARFVIVPLKTTHIPRGLTVIVQALRLGKPVITTTNPALDWYVRDGYEGFRVEPGDILGYREAIMKLMDPAVYAACKARAIEKGRCLSSQAAVDRFAELCETELLEK